MRKFFLAIFTVTLFITCARAQSDSDQPVDKLGNVDFSGSIRERVEFWDWFNQGNVGSDHVLVAHQNDYTFSDTLARFAFSQTGTNFDWKLDIAIPVIAALPNRAVQASPYGQLGLGGTYYAANSSQSTAAFIFPKQGYVRFKSEHAKLQLGRFEFFDGAEVTPANRTLAALKNSRINSRLLGTFSFSAVQRSFDGANAGYTNGGWNITAMGAVPTRGVFQVDGWGWVKTPVSYVATTHQVSYSAHNAAEWRIFGIYYQDPRSILKTDNRSVAARTADLNNNIRIGTYGGHYIQAIDTEHATFDLLAWGAAQTGSWGSLAQRSAAGAAEAGIQPNIWKAVKPWLRGGYFYASGDGNSKDGTHGTFFDILYTPRIYTRFPFYNQMNNRDAFGELILRPSKLVTIRTDFHSLSLASKNDLWYGGGGAFQPWTFGYTGRPANGHSDLANLYDTSIDYTFIKASTIGFYYGYAQGGDVIRAIYKNANGQYGFIELNYRF